MYIGRYYGTPSYYTSLATCTPCPKGDWWCGAMKWGCDVQNDLAINPTVTTLAPARSGSTLDVERQKIVAAHDKVSPPSSPSAVAGGGAPTGIGKSRNCEGCNSWDIGCYAGKAFCEAGGFFNDMMKWGGIGPGGIPVPILIMLGGVGVISVLILARRR